jgi:hypothetical protein
MSNYSGFPRSVVNACMSGSVPEIFPARREADMLDATAAFTRAYSDTVRADLDSGWPTVRRHPRTLSEAFADSRAAAIERPRPRDKVLDWGHRAVWAVCLVGGCIVLAMLLAERFAR